MTTWLAAVLGVLLLHPVGVGRPAKPSPWHGDYEAARAEAKRTGKPLLVVFRCEH